MTPTPTPQALERGADALFRARFDDNARRTDKLFAFIMVGQWLFAIAIALWFSPYGWEGKTRSVHIHVQLAVFLGAALSGVPLLLIWRKPGWVVTRHVVAVSQMLWSAVLIHLTGGRIETHFHVFGSLAFLAFYRDWKVLIPATIVVASDHLLRQLYWPESVYGITDPEWWRFLEHAGWVLFEDVCLIAACLASVREMRLIAAQQIAVEVTEGKAKEMEIAASIQTSILPRDLDVPGLETAARMLPAELVGGDYYDVLPVPGGCWIAIGDVAGHGVRAGLTMLQAQSALAALVRHDPNAAPQALWASLNRTYFDNVRRRLRHDEHMTFSLLRYHDDGRFEVVGAHEDLVIWRAARADCEIVPVQGTWVGLAPEIAALKDQRSFRLGEGDMLILYTDGIIEARDATGHEVGLDTLCDVVRRKHNKSVDEIRDALFAMSSPGRVRDDDASVLVIRYRRQANVAAA
jgi:hypothetical protein